LELADFFGEDTKAPGIKGNLETSDYIQLKVST
jgi:hypothetical protein